MRDQLASQDVRIVIGELRLGNLCLLNAWQLLDLPPKRTALILFTHSDDLMDYVRAAASGAFDFVTKTEPVSAVFESIAAVLAGKPLDPRGVLKQKQSRLRKPREPVREDIPLTGRELQVLKHVALGLSNREIARSLKIGVETIKEHIQNILRKLNLNDRTHAAVWAVRKDLI
jgi:DNA-binding NarL/FixJ family response regulator